MGDWEDTFGVGTTLDDLENEGLYDNSFEKENAIKKEYERRLEVGKSMPENGYHNSRFKKFGFSNFKPYEDIKPFSNKPITLIYGPNSIGKSSLIHMMAYNNYIHKTKNLDLKNTDMFGDNINLGGFSKFIHKRDKNNTLKLEYQFEDCSDAIIDFLNIKKISQSKIEALKSFSLKEIEDIINNSDQYIHTVFDTKIEELFGIARERDTEEIEKLQFKRKNNSLCNSYSNECGYLDNIDDDFRDNKNLIENYYKIIPYVYSFEFNDTIFNNDYADIDLPKKSDEDFDLSNTYIKNKFISDIIIPHYINNAKLQYLISNQALMYKEDKKFTTQEINKIAELTIDFIRELSDEFEFLNKLKTTNVSLKIIVEIGYPYKDFVNTPDNVDVLGVSYYLDNQLFDKLEWNNYGEGYSLYSERIYIDTMSYDLMDCKAVIPNIFKSMPDFLKDKVYLSDDQKESGSTVEYFKDPINKMHEDKTSILFLSYKNGYDDLIGTFNDMLGFNEMQYIGPLRFYPERDASFKELDSNTSIIPDSQTSWSYLKEDVQLRENINKWLKDENKLKTPYEIKYRELYDISSMIEKTNKLSLNEIIDKYLNIYIQNKNIDNLNDIDEDTYEVDERNTIVPKDKSLMFTAILKKLMKQSDSKEELVFEDLRNGTQISNRDLGLGISQILPILIATNRQKNMTIAVEQPELHLHPAVQCEIADEFIRSAKENQNRFLIETHSEHLLLRIMRRLRETADGLIEDKNLKLTPDDVCILYIDSENEKTEILELRLSKTGKLLDRWPNGFFEEGFKERFS
ncbi:MAG: hypothetical protein CL623_05920 [Arcobacter sp.]|nr:hypothetical protein [Arcobacter sp.]